MPAQGFQGLHVLTLESRRAAEISRLIETYQGKPLSAPAVREIPLTENEPSLRFARELIAGNVDMVIFLTGVGAKALRDVIEGAQLADPFLAALRRVKVVARGPKPLAVLREWNVAVLFTAPEPCTWREVLRGLDDLPGGIHAQRVVVQEYGASNPEFLSALRERGARVEAVAVYQWALPLDTEPLRTPSTRCSSGNSMLPYSRPAYRLPTFSKLPGSRGRKKDFAKHFRRWSSPR